MAKRPPIKYDFSPNALFRAGPDWHLNAAVGDNGGPYDLMDYGLGFFEAGRHIIERASEGVATVDIVVYPAAFAFRHGIELFLKHLIEKLLEWNRLPPGYDKNHGIVELFDLVAEQIKLARVPIADPTEVSIARDIVVDFNQIDPTGQVFRYPEDLKGNKHLIGLSIINVGVLNEGMRMLEQMMESWIDQLGGFQLARLEYPHESD